MHSSPVPRLKIEEGLDYVDVDQSWLPYKVRRKLGHGACSTVDEVEDLNTGHIYARKLFVVKTHNKSWMTETFYNELKIIRFLGKHHHLISVYASYATDKTFAIILSPMADGGDLHNYLEEYTKVRKSNPSPRRTEMKRTLEKAFGCLAAGLAFIHSQKIRHKDIKTRNILVYNGRVLYTDFGIAYDSKRDMIRWDSVNSSTEGPTSMTLKYAAPEVIAAGRKNSKSDVYSLGCVFIEIHNALTKSICWTGKRVFADFMRNVHRQLYVYNELSNNKSKRPAPSFVIPSMTRTDARKRPTAQRVWKYLAKCPYMGCVQCRDAASTNAAFVKGGQRAPSTKRQYSRYVPTHKANRVRAATTAKGRLTRANTWSNANQRPTIASHGQSFVTKDDIGAVEGQIDGAHWTPWQWYAPHGKYYMYLLRDTDNHVLKTLWACPQPAPSARPGRRVRFHIDDDKEIPSAEDGDVGDWAEDTRWTSWEWSASYGTYHKSLLRNTDNYVLKTVWAPDLQPVTSAGSQTGGFPGQANGTGPYGDPAVGMYSKFVY